MDESLNTQGKKILVVDDEERNIRLLSHLCQNLGYSILTAGSGSEAIEKTAAEMPDLILMDVMMPGMDGFEATERIKKDDKSRQIPIIIVTALDQKKDKLKGISIGANDFLSKPIDTEELSLRIRNNLEIKDYHDFLKNHNAKLEIEVSKRTEELKKAYEEVDNAYRKVQSSYIETIQRLNMAAEYKDEETGAHISRISLYTKELAGALGMDFDFIETIYYASPMHDIGKVGIPDSIMMKTGALSAEEWEIMKSHTTIGAKILSESESPFLTMAKDIALSHHEKWDGTGYPYGLKGEAIPLPGRIVNIVDQYDALRSKRPYKATLPHNEVMQILTEGDGRTSSEDFDPQVLEAFKRSASKVDEIFSMTKDEQKEAHLQPYLQRHLSTSTPG